MALWRLMTPTLAGSSASAGSASASPTIGKTNDALFTTDSFTRIDSVPCRLLRRHRWFGSRDRRFSDGRPGGCRRRSRSGGSSGRRILIVKLDDLPGDVDGIGSVHQGG